MTTYLPQGYPLWCADVDDPVYGTCDTCRRVGYEVDGCYRCGALTCPFCDHDCPDED